MAADARPIRAHVYNVPFGSDFCDATVSLLLGNAQDQAISATETILFLPNNRAVKAMTEAFVRHVAPGLLLPRMVAIGDLALDEAAGPMLDPMSFEDPIWPAINPTDRLMLLAKLVTRHRPTEQAVTATEALRLARKLAELIDELEIEEVSYQHLLNMSVEAELAGHWQQSYGQVREILPAYYDELKRLKLLGPSQRRNLLLDRLNDRLKGGRSKGRIVAAGITTSAPAVARVLSQISKLPNGSVMLHGVDLDMEEAQWDALGPHEKDETTQKPHRNQEAHPQFHLKLLLDRMGIRREEIQTIGRTAAESKNRQIADVFCLPSDTAKWRELPKIHKRMPSVALLEAADSSQEARAIAIKMRGALETAGKRAALITPDRELALRVATQLRRWNIAVDDSAGTPILQTPHGRLINVIGEAISDNFSPVSLMAMAKHPLVHAGDGRLGWLEQTRALDIVLRGPPGGVGLNAIDAAINRKAGNDEALRNWWQGFAQTLSPLPATYKKSFGEVMDAVRQVADKLTDGNIWKGATGRQLATLWEEITACDLSAIGRVDQAAIPALLSELLGKAVVRPPYGGHPRIAIYGLLEARMQQADIVICGGLNETSWPQIAQPDPWLAPAIRRYLGLATLDRNIGLSAHDLATALGASEVLLTRAKRDRSGPTVASRFVLRMKAFLGEALIRDTAHAELATQIDLPKQKTPLAIRPEPRPNADQRMVALSVTDFDQLKSDPYSFYAKRILGFHVLEPVNADPSYAWRGTLVHDILEQWFKEDRCAPDALIARAEDMLTNTALDPTLRTLWQPRIAAGLRWIAEETKQLLDGGRSLLVAEQTGRIELLGVPIKGRADRIDRLPNNELAIIDYKTGVPPKGKQVSAGFALQLGLIGLMAESGSIAGVTGKASRFEYWSLAKNKERGFGFVTLPTSNKAGDKNADAADFVAFVRNQAEAALRTWIIGDAAFTAKLHPDYANYEDYDQLMRLQEWNGRQPITENDLA